MPNFRSKKGVDTRPYRSILAAYSKQIVRGRPDIQRSSDMRDTANEPIALSRSLHHKVALLHSSIESVGNVGGETHSSNWPNAENIDTRKEWHTSLNVNTRHAISADYFRKFVYAIAVS